MEKVLYYPLSLVSALANPELFGIRLPLIVILVFPTALPVIHLQLVINVSKHIIGLMALAQDYARNLTNIIHKVPV